MSLSDEIVYEEEVDNFYWSKDVKESIKRLKTKMEEWHSECFTLENVMENVNEEFGEKLI